MSRRVLITGASGFVGQWLSSAMLEAGWTVFGGTIQGPPAAGILSRRQAEAIHWLTLDVVSDADMTRALGESAPDAVVHLAGLASPPQANKTPVLAFKINALGALRLLTQLASGARTTRVLIVGSAEQYGAHDGPIPETAPLRPRSPYGASKAAQEVIALQVFRASGVPVICTRSFNHSGLGHADEYLLPALVRRARALPASGGTLVIGNGTPLRDYLHVKDVVSAYILLLEAGAPGEVYNVSSGTGISVRALAERVLDRFRVRAAVETDPALVRPSDIPMLVGDNSKLRTATGWKPAHSIDDIIDDLIHAAPR